VGLMTKHSMLLFGLGLVAGLALTPVRRHFREGWLYVAGGIAVVIFLPNLVWQAAHGWPTAVFLRGLNADVMSGISLIQFLAGQILYLNPFTAPIWIAGLWFLLRGAAGRPYRILGWLWLAPFALLLLAGSKIYYLAPAYPALLAAGGIAWERLAARLGRPWLRPVLLGSLVLGGAALAPMSIPILSIDATERYIGALTFGAFQNVYELTGDLRGMFGWEERVRAVAEVYSSLPSEERDSAVIFGDSYGVAGAIDHFGRRHGLPKAMSFDMTYYLWSEPDRPIEVMITAGVDAEDLQPLFEEVHVAERIELANVNPWDREFIVTVCRRPKVPLRDVWARNRPW